ncbi:hypothetical protein C2G38_878319 [Gigaspora rosea]|uniref:Uncharacterized protein n=1 Tax=Gigaspora rosea TaxID=44941 RepID=A0A397TYG6_9GLOM|nr:hypothetical protein C2G38_878319 [Gigaspora rosea]
MLHSIYRMNFRKKIKKSHCNCGLGFMNLNVIWNLLWILTAFNVPPILLNINFFVFRDWIRLKILLLDYFGLVIPCKGNIWIAERVPICLLINKTDN